MRTIDVSRTMRGEPLDQVQRLRGRCFGDWREHRCLGLIFCLQRVGVDPPVLRGCAPRRRSVKRVRITRLMTPIAPAKPNDQR